MSEKKYGLILRAPKSKQNTQLTRSKPVGFMDDDDDGVEGEISRHATKNRNLKEVEEQHKKAIEEDPSVFDYDGVYDDMKSKMIQPKVQERKQRESKYVGLLKEKAKLREREHEVVYERKLAKERSKDEHLFADKDKFVTGAYKKKLAEKEQWEREERLRQLREERDDVTKKSDITDFYFNLSKNVAFGASDKPNVKKPEKREKEPSSSREIESNNDKPVSASLPRDRPSTSPVIVSPPRSEDGPQKEASDVPQRRQIPDHQPHNSEKENPPPGKQPPNEQPKGDHHKKNEDALAAAKERFLARKRAKVVVEF